MDLELRRLNNYSASTFYCWAEDPREASMHDDVFSMTVDRDMVDYFSQPEGRIDLTSFIGIYCLNPPKNDGCPVGICPNPDIAGPLVRIACMFSFPFIHRAVIQFPPPDYITAFCLSEYQIGGYLVPPRSILLSSYPHLLRPKARERRVLLPNTHRLRPPHHMFCVPLPRKHHATPRNNRNIHCIIPGYRLFPSLFHQGFLGRTSSR